MRLTFQRPNAYVGKVLKFQAKHLLFQIMFHWPNPRVILKLFNRLEFEFHPAIWHMLPTYRKHSDSFVPFICFRWLFLYVEWRLRAPGWSVYDPY